MKRYPLIGAITVIAPPTEVLDNVTGLVFNLAALGQVIDSIEDGAVVQNVGSAIHSDGKVAVVFHNDDDSVDLVVTTIVTAVLTEIGGKTIAGTPTTISIPPGDVGIIGPFPQANEDVDKKVNFTFTGTSGRCYAISVR